MNMTPDELSERLPDFAVRIGKLVDVLPNTRLGRHVAGQLVRSGTSPGPNYEEACAAESRADFSHKMSIALKELRESRYWLRFIVKAKLLAKRVVADLSSECNQLCNIFGKSVATTKGKAKKRE